MICKHATFLLSNFLQTLEEFVLWSEMQQGDYSLAKISIFAALSLTYRAHTNLGEISLLLCHNLVSCVFMISFEEIPIASIHSTRLFTWFQQVCLPKVVKIGINAVFVR